MDDRLDSSAAVLEQWGARRNRMLDTYFRGALRERYEKLRSAAALDTRSLDRYRAAADALRTRLIDEGLGGWPARPATIRARVNGSPSAGISTVRVTSAVPSAAT